MKKNLLFLCTLLSLFVIISCQRDPQKHAADIAEKEETKADMNADMAESQFDKGAEHVEKAVEHATMEELNSAMAAVPVPTLSNVTANELVKKIGNQAVEYVNSNNFKEAGKYADKINASLNEVTEKTKKGSITADDDKQIREYASSLASAVGLQL